MHRAAAHAGRTFLRRPRVLLALAVVGAGLAAALYLPTRNDTASAHENRAGSAHENRAGRITVCERRDGRHVWRWTNAEGRTFRDRECRRTWTARPADDEWFPTPSPSGSTTVPPTPTSPSVSEDPSTEPTPTESASTEPTATEPEPTATTLEPVKQSESPSATPTKVSAPKWKLRTAYAAGDLVSFDGKVYRAKEAHTALPGWEPSKLKELFERVD
ncbi:carbohydrate binding protein [Krasilnikovia cinnamomea]|uniref:Carbohydrate binding protein n=1 Tax=Krasilnikovia cinnamomea TaxID=349313 RepID=A0A4Q7ZGX9_9ACTN|nr:carbohydrate-binding protein [Krasilnikovia cinnamomea]RZU50070.1 carbohydrate binding protein [Krasilnikovia cinnamomea]